MSDQLLLLLQICLLVLLYLFFLRVIRAVWTEVSHVGVPAGELGGDAPAMKRRSKRKIPTGLKVLEPKEMAGRTFVLTNPTTIGRGSAATITLEDSFLSSVHARIAERDGRWVLEDLGSTNGTFHAGNKVVGPEAIRRGDRIQVGSIVIEAT